MKRKDFAVFQLIASYKDGLNARQLKGLMPSNEFDEKVIEKLAHRLWLNRQVDRRWLAPGQWHYYPIGKAPNSILGYVEDEQT